MELEKIIKIITRNEERLNSKELFEFVTKSEENEKEFVRVKNLWALLQKGYDMDEASILKAYDDVKKRAGLKKKKSIFISMLKYAAIIFITLKVGNFVNNWRPEETVAKNEISVPPGNRTSVVLPDSTKVWITNGTTLCYPDKFDSEVREVVLEGEAYFEVTHDEEQPFYVILGEHRVRVFGTKFAVVAYPDDSVIRTDLISGAVTLDIKQASNSTQYQSYTVKPSHNLIYYKETGKVTEAKISAGFYSYWQNGIYEFTDEKFERLVQKIERIYNVKVVFEDESLKNKTFTGTFKVDDNIYTLMEVFQKASGTPFEYRVDRDIININ